MGWGVGLGIISFVSIFAGGEEDRERDGDEDGERGGDGDIVVAAGRQSASKSGEVGYWDEHEEDDDCGESCADGVS